MVCSICQSWHYPSLCPCHHNSGILVHRPEVIHPLYHHGCTTTPWWQHYYCWEMSCRYCEERRRQRSSMVACKDMESYHRELSHSYKKKADAIKKQWDL